MPKTPTASDASGLPLLILDAQPAGNGASKTPNQWIEYWNEITDGRRFASAADIYQAGKQARHILQRGSEQEKAAARQLLASLQEDFNESWLVMSTRIFYQPASLEARIIHNYGNKDVGKVRERAVLVPEYLDTPLSTLQNDAACEAYLRAYFDTTDNVRTITETLSTLSGYAVDMIKLWTSPLRSNQWVTRSQLQERAVGLGAGDGGFHVVGGSLGPDGYGGRSRGALA